MKKLILLCLAIGGWLIWACDSGNPVAPSPAEVAPAASGVTFTLGLSISPSQLIAGSGVPGTVTVTAKRDDNGESAPDGTLVTVSTDKGDFGGNNGDLVTLGLSDGSATASLFPTAAPDTATLIASLADSSTTLSVSIVEGVSGLFISGVDPRSGGAGGGTRVRIDGGGFEEPLTVSFGGAQASVVSVTATAIVADTPAPPQSVQAGQTLTVDVSVTNALGTSDSTTVTLFGGFVYVGEGAAFITLIDPSSGQADEETPVTIEGGGFDAPVRVEFGTRQGTDATVLAGGTEIAVTTPTSEQSVGAGQSVSVNVTVTSGLDQDSPQTVSLSGGFTYLGEDTVFVDAVDPSSGLYDIEKDVIVEGGGFQTPILVEFGGKQGTEATVNEAGDKIDVKAPTSQDPVAAGETLTVDVKVTSGLNTPASQEVTLTGGYTYLGDSVVFVTSVSPSSALANVETENVMVSGGGFETPVTVEFGGTQATDVVLESSTVIKVTAPTSPDPVGDGETLTVDVKVTSGQDQQEATLTGGFTYLGDSEVVVSAISPTSGTNAGGTTVTITGQGFDDPVSVELDGIRQQGPDGTTSEVVDSSTTIRFSTAGETVSSCPSGGEIDKTGITVTNLDTGASGSSNLTYTYTVPSPRTDQVSPSSGFQTGGFLVSLLGDGFESPARVKFKVSNEEFTAVVSSVSNSTVLVFAPSVPNSVLPESDCTVSDNPGKRYENATADVEVTNLDTGCTDTLGNAFTYVPTDTSCRQTGTSG